MWTPSDVAQNAFTITKSDSTIFPNQATSVGGAQITKAIYVGGSGDLAVVMNGSTSAITFPGVIGGTILPISVRQVMSTNTTATNIVGIY